MARVIKFYVPKRFKHQMKLIPQEQKGKIIAFSCHFKKSA
jgi:hypothetical protein